MKKKSNWIEHVINLNQNIKDEMKMNAKWNNHNMNKNSQITWKKAVSDSISYCTKVCRPCNHDHNKTLDFYYYFFLFKLLFACHLLISLYLLLKLKGSVQKDTNCIFGVFFLIYCTVHYITYSYTMFSLKCCLWWILA